MCTSHNYLLPDKDGASPWRQSHVRLVLQAFAVVAVLDGVLVALLLMR